MFGEYLNRCDLLPLLTPPGMYHPFPRRQERDKWEALGEERRAALLAWGEEAKAGYPALTATQFLAFCRSGSRAAYETPYFERRRKLMGAVLAECTADDGSYMDAVVDGVWCLCEESAWILSAHNGSDHPGGKPMDARPLPDTDNQYVDLFAAQTAALLADTLYLLEDKFDAFSPLLARRVRREIDRRVLRPFETHDDFWWMGYIRRDVNNWNPWILSNVIDTALLLERDAVRRAEIIERALRMLDNYLAVMPEDGGCDEGVSYFNMAGAALLDCMESVYLASDGRVSFYHEPLIRAIGTFPLKAHIDGPYFFNFADCDAMPRLDGERIFMYGVRTENEPLARLGAWLHGSETKLNPPARPVDTPQMHRTLLKLFADVPNDAQPPQHLPFESFEKLQVYCWRKGGLLAAIKGGHNGESHNHNDVGNFVVYADGMPQIVDMGNKVYTAVTFSPASYTLDNTRSENHNVPLIGDIEQCAGSAFGAKDVCADESGASMENGGAYPAEAGVISLRRRLTVTEGGVALEDCAELSSAKEVTWVLMLRHQPEISEGVVRTGALEIAFDPKLTAQAQEMPVTDARMARSFPGSLWRLTLNSSAACSHEITINITRS